jgi:hypothetical protein
MAAGPTVHPAGLTNDQQARWEQAHAKAREQELSAIAFLASVSYESAVYEAVLALVLLMRRVAHNPFDDEARAMLADAMHAVTDPTTNPLFKSLSLAAQKRESTSWGFAQQILKLAEAQAAGTGR